MKRMKKTRDHIVMGGEGMRCLHCGTEQPLGFPVSINVMKSAGEGFTKDHAKCKASEKGKSRFVYKNQYEWLRSWDTGLSSLTIYSVFERDVSVFSRSGMEPTTPMDADDFGRCYRLLAVTPEWRKDMAKVGECFPRWKPIIERWDELEALYVNGDRASVSRILGELWSAK